MRVIRKTVFSVLLLIAILFVQNASATLVGLLPDSSYAEAEGNWQGHRIYDEYGFNVLVEFAVYDTANLQPDSEEEALAEQLESLNITGRYIYAYQIFNNRDANENVAFFGLLNIDRTALDETLDDIGSYDSNDGGIPPADASQEGNWTWDWQEGFLTGGEHSWFLVFSSDYAPIAGDYEIKGPEEEGDDVPIIPEPATIALLGLGSAVLFKRRKKLV